MLSDPSLEVHNIFPVNEETMVIIWGCKEEVCEQLPTANVCIAAYTTTQARLQLL